MGSNTLMQIINSVVFVLYFVFHYDLELIGNEKIEAHKTDQQDDGISRPDRVHESLIIISSSPHPRPFWGLAILLTRCLLFCFILLYLGNQFPKLLSVSLGDKTV